MADTNTPDDKTPVGRPNIYVQSLTFNDGTTLAVNKNDIVIFVGPNNVGKSQTLRDIQSKSLSENKTVMLQEVAFSLDPSFPYEAWAERVLFKHVEPNGQYYFAMFGKAFYQHSFLNIRNRRHPGELSTALISFLKTEERLQIADPPPNINIDETPNHPIHLLRTNSTLRKKISETFQKAFGVPTFPFERFGKTTPLVLGEYPAPTGVYQNEIEREEAVATILRQYPHLEEQGDGMRSFVGLMLYLIIDYYNVFLVDEPESFLHPPQARLMGEIFGELITHEQQTFVSTHSIHFIQGLLEKCPERVKVVRITRSGDTNTFSLLDNNRLLELSKDPFLKHSNLLEGLFYKNVVLCEADSDCMFYSMVNGAPDMKGTKGADTLFIHCGGKQRMASVARDLWVLHVDFRVIPDFDILNDKDTVKKLVEACNGDWGDFDRDFTILSSDIQNRSKHDKSESVLFAEISAILPHDSSKPVSNNKKESIQQLLAGESEWDRLKKSGISGIPSGDPHNACNSLFQKLANIRIHVVPCGELERFLPDCVGHGPAWIQDVLEKHPVISDAAFNAAKEFVRSWNL